MLPMLNVTGMPGVVYLNGMFCGKRARWRSPCAGRAYSIWKCAHFHPAARRPFCGLKLRTAACRRCHGASFRRTVAGRPHRAELRGDETLQTASAPPQLLARLPSDMGEYLFVAEEGVASFGRDAQEAVFLPVASPGDAQLRPLAIPGLCAVTGSCRDGRYAAVLRAQGAPELLACGCGLTAEVDAGGALRCLESVGDFAAMRIYAPMRLRRKAFTGGFHAKPHGKTARPASRARPRRRRALSWKRCSMAPPKKRQAIYGSRPARPASPPPQARMTPWSPWRRTVLAKQRSARCGPSTIT